MASFKNSKLRRKSQLEKIIYIFPIQLFFLSLKKNHVHLLYWLLLFGFVIGDLGTKWGIPSLFLAPEYLGEVSFTSLFILGIGIGGFIMTYHISTYILNSHRFPFLATLSRPFFKYVQNNSIIPGLFVICFLVKFYNYQKISEFRETLSIIWMMCGFLLGIIVTTAITLTYFFSTNKDIFKLIGIKENEYTVEPEDVPNEYRKKRRLTPNEKAWRVDTYICDFYKIRLVRSTVHYKTELIERIFRQNHINAALFELMVFIELILLGLFREYPLFKIPAAGSLVLIFSLFIMILGALRFWLRNWANTAFIALFLILNYFSQFEWVYPPNKLYGMDYEHQSLYNNDEIRNSNEAHADNDRSKVLATLNRWQKTQLDKTGRKPYFIIFNVSGGGSRAAGWTFRVMQALSEQTNNAVFENARLITGASGGMIGAAYYRELYLQHLKDKKTIALYDHKFYDRIVEDLLNPLGISIALNDLFIRIQRFYDGRYRYIKDRAYAFEKQLNENLHDQLNKRLRDYIIPEADASIPYLLMSPTVVNDGRRLMISSQPMAFLCNKNPEWPTSFQPVSDCIEFSHFFSNNDPGNTRITSLLRANATFPYITPDVSLPSTPRIEVLDAGARDNLGNLSCIRFIYEFRRWIEEKTAGVIVIQIRDTQIEPAVNANSHKTLLQSITSPAEVAYINFTNIQHYNQDDLWQYMSANIRVPMKHFCYQLPSGKEHVSLSWHLTKREKRYVFDALSMPENQQQTELLLKTLNISQNNEITIPHYDK